MRAYAFSRGSLRSPLEMERLLADYNPRSLSVPREGGGGSQKAKGLADFENVFARISDSERHFNGFADPGINHSRKYHNIP